MKAMTIGHFAKAGGVGIETVRFYHRRGLVPLPRAGSGKFREYDALLLQRLRFVRQAQVAGFTLSEIKELLRLNRTQDRARIRSLASARLTDLDAKVRELRGVMKSLKTLVSHCESAPDGHACPIIEAFDHPHRR